MSSDAKKHNPLTGWLHLPNDSKHKTFIVAALLSLICSLLVATSAVMLKPKQQANKQLEIQRNILAVASIDNGDKTLDELFKEFIEIRLVDLQSGNYIEHDNPASYNWREAMKDETSSSVIPAPEDIAKIKRRPHKLPVYLVKENSQLKRIILPVYGYGLWSTLYGFIALESDANTVAGLSFYEQAETPGLGGEVDNPRWRQLWQGKIAYDAQGKVRLEAIRGHVKPEVEGSQHQVDGLSGATLTSQGVTNLLQYWLGEHGFAPFLKRFRESL